MPTTAGLPGRDRAQDGRQSRQTSKGRPYVRTEQELRPEPPGLSVREVVWRAVEHLAERASVFRESDIRAIALSHAPGRHGLGEIDAAVTGLLADGHLVEARVRSGRSFVTADALRSEREIMARMRDGIGAAEALAEEARVSEHLDGTILTEGQREAVRTILLSHDRIVAVQGVAGAGKTTMLREVLDLIGERKAILLAPSAAAARVLADETGARVRTVQWFLTRYGDLGNAAKMAIARREHEGSVLVLDESSMTSTAQMHLLMRISERLRVARLVLVGDRGQLRAVGAGEPFRALQDAGIAMAEMDEILRQRDPGLKRAVKALQQGRAAEAVRGFGEVREVPHEELGAEAARLWLALDEEQRAGTAILAPTHFIRAEIHRVVREGLAREGVLHGRELEIERYVNRHLTAAQRADVRHHEPGDFVIFHSRVPPLRVDEGDACRIARAEDGFVFLDHPSGRTVRIRPGDSWVRYRFGIYETARIRIRAGDRVRWTRNDKRHDLLNGGEAVVLGIDSRRVRFDLGGGKTLSLARDDPQLRHIDHAWSTTIHAAQGMTRDAAIGVLDTGHGRLTGQAGLYVEASRARDRFVLVTDNRETLEEALEDNGARLTAREAVGETDPPAQPADAAIRMLRDLRDDWRALVARAEAETTELNRMEGYARIVTGVQALAAGLELPPEMQAFVDEVRQRDARMVEGRRDELAFVQKAEAHCHRHPLLKWAAEERGLPVSDLPEHAAWLAEGAALEEAGRRMQETPGFVGRIAAALGRIAQGFRLDEGERFHDAAARHEAEARRLGIDPGSMTGTAQLVQRAEALGRHELPEAVRRTVEAWTPEPDPPAPERVHRPAPGSRGGRPPDRGVPAGLPALPECGRAWGASAGPADRRGGDASPRGTAAAWRGRGSEARRSGTHPAVPRSRRTRTGARGRGRAGAEAQGLRSRAFMELSRSVAPHGLEAHPDPVDLPAWGALRDRAEALRGEAGLAPDAREAVDAVLARDARVEAEIAPVRAFLEEGVRHLERRVALDEGGHGIDPPSPDAIPAWRERSQDLRETALSLLGESPADTRETQAAASLADMPRLQGRVREVLDRLETLELRDEVADFQKLAATIERRARRQETLPLFAEGYGHATAMAQTLTSRAALPEAPRHEAAAWLDRDRSWKEELASALKLTEAQEQDVDRASLPEALPEAFREAARLAGGRDRSRRRRPDRRNRRPGPVGGRMRPRRLVRRGAQAAGSRPAVLRAQRRLPARLFRARRGRPHRLDRGRRPQRRGADDRGRGRHADRDPRRARDRAPDDPRLRPRRAGARRLDPAHRRGGHRARLLPCRLVRRGPARAHSRPAEGGPGADPDATPRALPRRRYRHVRCGNLGGRLRLAVRGRAQRRSTEQRRHALHPLPELPFDDRPVVGAEHSLQQRPELTRPALPDKVVQGRHEQQLDRLQAVRSTPRRPPTACSRPGGPPGRAAGAVPPRSAPEPARPSARDRVPRSDRPKSRDR